MAYRNVRENEERILAKVGMDIYLTRLEHMRGLLRSVALSRESAKRVKMRVKAAEFLLIQDKVR